MGISEPTYSSLKLDSNSSRWNEGQSITVVQTDSEQFVFKEFRYIIMQYFRRWRWTIIALVQMISRCIQDVPKMMQYGNIPHKKEGRAEPVIHMSYQVQNSFIL